MISTRTKEGLARAEARGRGARRLERRQQTLAGGAAERAEALRPVIVEICEQLKA